MTANTTRQLPSCEFATIPKVAHELAVRRVGRNGWAVMVALYRKLYEDGWLGVSSSKEMSRFTGLTSYQVARAGIWRYDVGVDANGYRPVSFEQIRDFIAERDPGFPADG